MQLHPMSAVSYNHAIVLSPCLYAPTLYVEDPDVVSAHWRHEDGARHLCSQLMSRYPSVALRSLHAIHSVPENFWTDANRVEACFFSQASRIIIFVPSDGMEQIRRFTVSCLTPLLTRTRGDGGRPDWHSRFLAVAIGNVEVPSQLAPGYPFVKVIRFREVGWIRDLTAIILLHREIKDFWLPPKIRKPESTRLTLTPVGRISRYGDPARFRLRETMETTLMSNVSTHVSGIVNLDTIGAASEESERPKPAQNGHPADGEHRTAGHSRSTVRSPSRSRSRQSSSSGYQSRDPEFEAEQCDEKQVELRLTNFMDANGRPTIWRFAKLPTSDTVSCSKVTPSFLGEVSDVRVNQTPEETADKKNTVKGSPDSSQFTPQHKDERRYDFQKTHRNDKGKILPEGNTDEPSKKDTFPDYSNSIQVPVTEHITSPASCLLDKTIVYDEPVDKENKKNDQTPELSEDREHKTPQQDPVKKRLRFSYVRDIKKDIPAGSTFQPRSRGETLSQRPCTLTKPEEQTQINPKLSIEQFTCFVAPVDSDGLKTTVLRANKVTSQMTESVVVETHSSCFDENGTTTVSCPPIDSQCEYHNVAGKAPSPTGRTKTERGSQEFPLPEKENAANSEPVLSQNSDLQLLSDNNNNEQRIPSDSIITTRKRKTAIVSKSEILSDSYRKVEKSKVMQVPVEVLGNDENIPLIDSVNSTPLPPLHDSNLQTAFLTASHFTKSITNSPIKYECDKTKEISVTPEAKAKPSSTLPEDKPCSKQPDIDRPMSPARRLVPIHVTVDPETRPRRDDKDIVECYSSFTSVGLDSKLHSSAIKKTTTQKSVTSTMKELSQNKCTSPLETRAPSPPSRAHPVLSPDSRGQNGADPTGQLRNIPDEVTMFYRDPHDPSHRLKPEGGQATHYSRTRTGLSVAEQYQFSSPSLHPPRSAPSNRVIYIRTTGHTQRAKSEDRCTPGYFRRAITSPTAPGSVRIYRSRGFANQDSLLSDACSQIESPLSTGYMEGHGVTCHASTGLHYRRRRPHKYSPNDEPKTCNIVLKDQNNWTGPDAAIMLRLELERVHWASGEDTAQPERIEIIKPTVGFGTLTPPEASSDAQGAPDSMDEGEPMAEAKPVSLSREPIGPKRGRCHLSLYICLASLAILLSMLATFFCLNQPAGCSANPDLRSFHRWVSGLTSSLAAPFRQPEVD